MREAYLLTRDRQAVARAVDAALARLGWTASDLTRETGLDPGTVGDFLNAGRWPQAPTRGKIERALGWEYGRIKLIAEGVDPGEVPDPTDRRAPDIAELLASDPTLSEASRAHIVAQYRLLQQLSRLEVPDDDGQDVDEQAIRDSRSMSDAQKTEALEALRDRRGRGRDEQHYHESGERRDVR